MKPTVKGKFLFVCFVLALLSIATQSALAQFAGAASNALTFENNFFVTGDYAVGGVGLMGLANKIYPGYAVGTISMGADKNPGVAGANNSVPPGADIVAALLYWQTIEIVGGYAGQNGFFRPVFSGGPSTGYAIQGIPLTNPKGTVYWNGSGCTTGSSAPKQLVTYVASVGPYLRQDANGNVVAGSNANPQNYEVKLPSQSNGTPLTFGATLVLIYRVMSPNFPLKSIILYDGTFSPSASSLQTANTIQGFYQADGVQSKLTYIVGNGQKNNSETVSLTSGNIVNSLQSLYGSAPPFPGWYSGGEWDNVTWTFPANGTGVPAGTSSTVQTASTVVTSAKAECVTPAAIIFSTTVANPDGDGLLPVWKNSRGYCDAASSNGTGVCTVGNASSGWVSLDDPTDHPQTGRKDVFAQLDYMVDSNASPLLNQANVNAAVARVRQAFLGSAENSGNNNSHNVHVHVSVGNLSQSYSGAIIEQSCTDFVTVSGLCPFPAQPGVVAWKTGFASIKNELLLNGDPTSAAQCTGTPPAAGCQPRFQHGRKDSFHYVMLGHAPGLTEWGLLGGSLTSVQQTGNSVTFTTSTSHGPLDAIGIVVPTSSGGLTTIDPVTGLVTGNPPPIDPSCANGRVTIIGADTNSNLNGTYCIQSSSDTTFTINIGGAAANASYSLSTDPNLSVAPGYVTTTSGISDEGGEDSLITLASWGPAATEKVIRGTVMHEFGHSTGLTHGGFSFPNAANGDYRPAVEGNCKPNFQSVMSYTRQFDLLQYLTGYDANNNPLLSDVVDYSEQSLDQLLEASAGGPGVFKSTPSYFYTSWYAPTSVVGGSPVIAHCDGSPITDGAEYNLTSGPANPPSPPQCPLCKPALNWSAGQDLNFNGNNGDTLHGYNDWASIDFRQVGATGSLSSTGGKLLNQGGKLLNQGGQLLNQGGQLLNQGGKLLNQGGQLLNQGGKLLNQGGKLLNQGGSEINLATANSATRPPQNLMASEEASARYVDLSWSAPSFGIIGAYRIYRSSDSGTTFTLIATVLGTQLTYQDTNTPCLISPARYEYYVTAVLAGTFASFPPPAGTGQESVASNTVIQPNGQDPLTGCYTVSKFLVPASAIQGQIVPITFTLTDDFYATANPVNRAAAVTSLVAIGPVGSDATCTTVAPGRVTLVTNGVQASLGASTFPLPTSGGQFTFSLDTDVVPFCAGSYTFELDLDSGQKQTTASTLQLAIDVTNSDSTPHVATVSLPKAIAGVFYTYAIPEHGGTAPFTWSLATGSTAPPGLTLSTSGTLSGTATDVGTYNFTVNVVDSLGNAGSQALSILIVAPVAQINQPVAPEILLLGGAAPTLTVNGEGFYAGSQVLWNGSALATNFVNTGQLTVTVPGSNVASLGAASISVANKNSSNSNVDFFQVSDPITTVSLSRTDQFTGTNPNAIITADFNGDGKQDLAIANGGSSTVSIFLGNGDGTFTVAATPSTGGVPHSLAVGDFNHDGNLDLAVANSGDGTLSVFLGKGDGTFQAQAVYAVGNAPVSLIAADFDRDGKLDLAAANQNDATVSILLGNGDGTFQVPAPSYAAVPATAASKDVANVTVGDFNGDNTLDLAVTNPSNDTVSVLLGKGDGTFQAPVTYSTGNTGDHPVAISAVDANGDGKLDLAVTNLNAKNVLILLGNGNGTFTATAPVSTTSGAQTGPSAIATGDFNADGKIDLAITNQGNSTVSILFGNGNGVFQSAVEFTTGNFAEGVAAGDFIGNGRLDLAVADHEAGSVSIMLQRPQVPANLAPGTATASQVPLTWTASVSTTVVGYNVYRGTVSGGPYTLVNVSPFNGNSYSDTTVASGTTYFYVVTAVDPHNLESDRSTEVSATTPPLPATNLTAAAASTGSVQLNWTASTTASVTGYNVYRSTTSGTGYTKVTLVNGTSYTDTGLTSGATYYYVVTTVGPSNLESVNSNEAFATTPPLPATNLTAAAASTGSVQLNWTASTTASVTGYNVYRSTTSGTGYVKITQVNGISYADTGLTSGITYYYVVTAVGPGNVESIYSNEAFATAP